MTKILQVIFILLIFFKYNNYCLQFTTKVLCKDWGSKIQRPNETRYMYIVQLYANIIQSCKLGHTVTCKHLLINIHFLSIGKACDLRDCTLYILRLCRLLNNFLAFSYVIILYIIILYLFAIHVQCVFL